MAALPTLYLIRHGETEWSKAGRHTGRSDIALNPHGEKQARDLAPLVQEIEFNRVFSSPRKRAQATCELVLPTAQITVEPDLAEWDYGEYEGLTTAEIQQDRPGWNIFRDGCPGGEDLARIIARADALLDRLKAAGGRTALFSHAHFGTVLAARWAGLEGEAAERLMLDPASLSVLGTKPRYPDVPAIRHWNVLPQARLIADLQN